MKPWTEKHRREALRRTYEIAAEIVSTGRHLDADMFVNCAREHCATERKFQVHVAFVFADHIRIDREVRRVHALAEGRLVRETQWKVRGRLGDLGGPYDNAEEARKVARGKALAGLADVQIVRVTRIRRAVR